MSIFLVCLNSVLPTFILILAGYLSRCAGIIKSEEVGRINAIAFRTFLPVMLFYNICHSDLSSAVRPRLIGFCVLCVFVIYALCVAYVLLFVKDKSKHSVMIQGLYRSNFIIVGLPVVEKLMEGTDLSPVAVLMGIIVPIFNVLAVLTLETFRGNRVKPAKILLEVLENPLIIGSVLGILFLLLGIRLPHALDDALGDIAGIASPLMLFLLGAFFRFESMAHSRKELIEVCLGRLVIIPGIFLTISYFVGFRGVEFVALLTVFASSTAVSSFTMAQQMGGDSELAGNIVVATSVCCALSLYMWCVIFMSLGAF